MAVCKSPITGGWGDANCGGNLSPAIKRCGYDAIFFKGISDKPVYLVADDKGAELRDAAHIWGKDAIEAEKILAEACKTKKKPAIAVIGQAGEKLSLISGISNDSGRMAARSGVGAVMGSKKLKAVVLTASKSIGCHDSKKVKAISKEFADKVRNAKVPKFIKGWLLPLFGKLMSKAKNASVTDGMMSVTMIKNWGTIVNNTLGIPNGDSPVKNWSGSCKDFTWKYYKNLNPDHLLKRQSKTYGCYSCPIRCGGICDIEDVKDGRFSHTHKPEYETCSSFGGLLMNKDLDAVFYINELLNRAGMDCISAGGTIAYAIECFEKGILTREDTGGIELTWGNADAIIKVVKLMINREGIGDMLADGVKKAAEKIGKGSDQFAVTAGGQEPGMHDSKMDPMLGVHFSAEPTPGRHTIGGVMYYNIYQLWEYVTWAPKVPAKYPKSLDYEISEENSIKAKANSCLKMLVDGTGGAFLPPHPG
jgi:aldehyde:ferredoxin oxidoreductase